MKSDKILIVGTDGLIGCALATDWPDKSVLETTRQPEKLSKNRLFLNLSQDISDWQPPDEISVAFICAAVASLERCRMEPAQSALVNVHNTLVLAKKLVAKGTFVVFLSTNLVYDGAVPFRKSEDAICPQTEYGRQKAEAERQLLAWGDSISVARFTKVLGPGNSLFNGWLQRLQQGEPIYPFSDMVMAPVSLSFAVEVLRRIADMRLPGIVQVSAKEDVTYAQVAQYIARRIGANPDRVQPSHSSQTNLNLEAVPAHTTLDTSRLQAELNLEPPDVWPIIDSVFRL